MPKPKGKTRAAKITTGAGSKARAKTSGESSSAKGGIKKGISKIKAETRIIPELPPSAPTRGKRAKVAADLAVDQGPSSRQIPQDRPTFASLLLRAPIPAQPNPRGTSWKKTSWQVPPARATRGRKSQLVARLHEAVAESGKFTGPLTREEGVKLLARLLREDSAPNVPSKPNPARKRAGAPEGSSAATGRVTRSGGVQSGRVTKTTGGGGSQPGGARDKGKGKAVASGSAGGGGGGGGGGRRIPPPLARPMRVPTGTRCNQCVEKPDGGCTPDHPCGPCVRKGVECDRTPAQITLLRARMAARGAAGITFAGTGRRLTGRPSPALSQASGSSPAPARRPGIAPELDLGADLGADPGPASPVADEDAPPDPQDVPLNDALFNALVDEHIAGEFREFQDDCARCQVFERPCDGLWPCYECEALGFNNYGCRTPFQCDNCFQADTPCDLNLPCTICQFVRGVAPVDCRPAGLVVFPDEASPGRPENAVLPAFVPDSPPLPPPPIP